MTDTRTDGDTGEGLPERCPECDADWGPIDPRYEGEVLRTRRCPSCGEWSRLV